MFSPGTDCHYLNCVDFLSGGIKNIPGIILVTTDNISERDGYSLNSGGNSHMRSAVEEWIKWWPQPAASL
jgi:hypothetical protein